MMNGTLGTGRTVRVLAAATVTMVALGLGGCSDIKSVFGAEKDPPDEFQVVSRAPLSLPPNFDLRPPEPGAERPQDGEMADVAAERILGRRSARSSGSSTTQSASSASSGFGGSGFGATFGAPAPSAAPAPRVGVSSAGDSALRDQLGTAQAEPNIRQVVNEETANFTYETRYPIDRLLFWKPDPVPGVVVNPTEETKRLRENAALGRPVTDGTTPTIERKRGGILEGLF